MAASFKSLMADFSQQLGHEFDEEWESPLEVAIDDVVVTFSEYARTGEEELLLFADLGQIDEANELETYRALLEANLLWSGTGDATIGVNSDTRHAVIAYRIALEPLDGEMLTIMASQFVALVAVWKAFIDGDELVEPELPDDGNAMANAIRV